MPSRRQLVAPAVPRLSWSLLAAIPKRRLLSIAQRLGRYEPILDELPPGRIAEQLLDVEKGVVGELTAAELGALADCLGITLESHRKLDMVRQLLRRGRATSALRKYDDLPEQLEDENNEDLRTWVDYYIRNAEADGYALDFSGEYSTDATHESTIRLVCQLWPMVGWPDWLMWQRYGGLAGRGPWWIACNFEEPMSWFNGRMILRNPWDFAFSDVFMASDSNDVTFELRKPRGRAIKDLEYKWLAAAVLSGLRYDYEDGEFILACTKEPNALIVRIWNPLTVDASEKCYKPGKDGICWWK